MHCCVSLEWVIKIAMPLIANVHYRVYKYRHWESKGLFIEKLFNLKGYSQNMRIVNRKFYIDRIGRFGQFQCKMVCKRTQNICKNV